ncbi:MAG: ROK family transcriptional regulator [Actinomycetota bacterium]|nr:ROK family transcriptional regulator [Actinomycetota bacterium]
MSTPGHLRERNLATLLDAMRHHGRISRAQLARVTGLSRTTVASIVDELERRGLIVAAPGDDGHGQRGRGRPATQVRLHPSAGVALGIFVGREDMRVALTDLSLTVLSHGHARFALDTPAETLLDLAAQLADAALADAAVPRRDLIGAGLGLPSPVHPATGAIDPTILANWADLPIRDALATRLATRVAIENDANLEALAELTMGAAKGLHDLIYVKASWGIGGAIVVDGRLRRGISGLAGELAHIQVRDDGPLCRCGRRGCLGNSASGHTMLAALQNLHGTELDLDDMIELARAGDAGVRRVLADAGREIGGVVASLCSILDPEAVVVGGELSGAGSPLLDGMREGIDRGVLAAGPPRRIMAAALGELAGPLGAASLIVRSGDIPIAFVDTPVI